MKYILTWTIISLQKVKCKLYICHHILLMIKICVEDIISKILLCLVFIHETFFIKFSYQAVEFLYLYYLLNEQSTLTVYIEEYFSIKFIFLQLYVNVI